MKDGGKDVRQTTEIQQHISYYWERSGLKRQLAPADGPEKGCRDYRMQEAKETAEKLKTSKIVFVRANSGYGITQFFVPALREQLLKDGVESEHSEILDMSMPKYANELAPVLIVDELSQSEGGLEGGFRSLHETLNERPDMRAVIIFDDQAAPELAAKFAKLHEIGNVEMVEIQPKLLSHNQAVEYILKGPPFRKPIGTDYTFFDGLNQTQTESIVAEFSKHYPLHFRLVRYLKNLSPQLHFNDDGDATYEKRLHAISSGRFNYDIDGQYNSDFLGIKPIKSNLTTTT